MNPQSTWRHTLIEACGAHLMILALATAVPLLHSLPADAGSSGIARAEPAAKSAQGLYRSSDEVPRAPLRDPLTIRP